MLAGTVYHIPTTGDLLVRLAPGQKPAAWDGRPVEIVAPGRAANDSGTDWGKLLRAKGVIAALGGREAYLAWIGRQPCAVGEGCAGEMTHSRSGAWPLPLCWHHECEEAMRNLQHDVARADYIQAWARYQLRQQMDVEAGALAALLARQGLELPPEVRQAAAPDTRPPDSRDTGMGLRETDARFTNGPAPAELLKKALVTLVVDDEAPAQYMGRPKMMTWECAAYTRWVKRQSCVCCGAQADDPHHVIGALGGAMGAKTHDLFVIPLCRQHHDELHHDVRLWEKAHGPQLYHVIKTINTALGLGVIE